jgi:hypothetical protein
MEISDWLTFIGIMVSIVLVYVTRFNGLFDQRTRCIKDYYISELVEIRREVIEFYNDLFSGKYYASYFVPWCKSHSARWKALDKSIPKDLVVYSNGVYTYLFDMCRKITDLEDFNNHYKKPLRLTPKTGEEVNKWELNALVFIDSYILDVNNARSSSFIVRWWRNAAQTVRFYWSYGPRWRLMWLVLTKLFYFVVILALLSLVYPVIVSFWDNLVAMFVRICHLI